MSRGETLNIKLNIFDYNILDVVFVLIVCISLIDNEQPATRASDFGWTAYHNLDKIYEWLDEQLITYPNLLTNLTVGLSYQNRTIRAVRLSQKAVSILKCSILF